MIIIIAGPVPLFADFSPAAAALIYGPRLAKGGFEQPPQTSPAYGPVYRHVHVDGSGSVPRRMRYVPGNLILHVV